MRVFPPRFSLLFGGIRWVVFVTSKRIMVRGDEVGGYCDVVDRHIRVTSGKTGRGLGFRLLEEIGHALCDKLDVDDDNDANHHLLRQFAGEVENFIAANPKFVLRLLRQALQENNSKHGKRRRTGPFRKYKDLLSEEL